MDPPPVKVEVYFLHSAAVHHTRWTPSFWVDHNVGRNTTWGTHFVYMWPCWCLLSVECSSCWQKCNPHRQIRKFREKMLNFCQPHFIKKFLTGMKIPKTWRNNKNPCEPKKFPLHYRQNNICHFVTFISSQPYKGRARTLLFVRVYIMISDLTLLLPNILNLGEESKQVVVNTISRGQFFCEEKMLKTSLEENYKEG